MCYEYEQPRYTVNLEKTLAAGHEIFPDSAYFLNSLINIYVYTNRNDKALEALDNGASLDSVLKMESREAIGRFKYVEETQVLKEYNDIFRVIEDEFLGKEDE